MILDEEKKKRYERARQLSNSINPSKTSNTSTSSLNSNFNNIVLNNYQGNTDEEKEYISRFQRARQLSNSINPREDVPAPQEPSEEDRLKSAQNAQNLIDLMDMNSIEAENNKYVKEANSDTNLFFQIGKTVENAWVGAVNGITEFFRTITDTDRVPKPSLNGQVQSINKNTPKEVVMAYQAEQQNKDNPTIENNSTNNLPTINLDSERQQQTTENASTENKPILFNLDVNNTTAKSLNNYKDAYGELELNAVQRDLTKATREQQEKIASNTNKISNPLLKKVSSLLPSMSNSLVGAGLSAVHPGLRNELFYAECSWK